MRRPRPTRLAVDALSQISVSGLKAVSALHRAAGKAHGFSPRGWVPALGELLQNQTELAHARSVAMRMARFVTRSFFREGLGRNVRQDTQRKYSVGRPWVQPSPIHFEGLPPTVLNVPDEEVQEFLDVVVSRYVRTLRRFWVEASIYAWQNPHLETLDDRDFTRIIQESPFSRFLNPQLDEADRFAFASLLRENGGRGTYFKVDFSPLAGMELLPGQHVAPTVTLFEEHEGALIPRAIRIEGQLVRPSDGLRWELARYYVLQGCALGLVGGIHPSVHFPMDTINAVTKTILPANHPVRQFLEPHCYLQLPLNYAVLYIDRSVAHNDQNEIYTPFPCTRAGFFSFTRAFHEGVPGNSSYPGYRFNLEPTKIHSNYGAFLSSYFERVLVFAREVAKQVAVGDPAVARWARHIAVAIPGFPGEDTIWEKDVLARALAGFVLNVSVVHSSDHYGYGRESINKVPLRLRMPFPAPGVEVRREDFRKLLRWEDIFRHRMAWEMYFKPSTVERLLDVEYPFTDPSCRQAAAAFRTSLAKLDVELGAGRCTPLSEIASSIQY